MNDDFKKLTFIDSLWFFFNGLIAPFIAIYFNNFGGLEEVGISIALRFLIQGITPLAFSKFLKKRKTSMKKWLLAGQLLESARIILFIFASSINHIYVIQILGGFTYSLISPAYQKIFVLAGSDEDDDAFRVRVGAINLMMGFAALLSGFAITAFGFAPVFLAWAGMEIIYGFFIFKYV